MAGSGNDEDASSSRTSSEDISASHFARNVTQRYLDERGERYFELELSVPDVSYDWIARSRARKLAPYIRPSDIVLEFGAGAGWNLAELNCARRIAFEPVASGVRQLRSRGIDTVDSTDALPDGYVDAAICSHVLEHVPEPSRVLKELHRLLRPGGTALLFVPYEQEHRLHQLLRQETTRRYRPDLPSGHLYSWNVQSFGELVTLSGLSVTADGLGRFGYDRAAAQWAVRLRFGESGYRAVRWLMHLVEPVLEVQLVARKV